MEPADDLDVEIDTERGRLDMDLVYRFLHDEAYWSKGISRRLVEASVEHSLCFGAFAGGAQVGFARVVTDSSTFAYVADVFVVPAFRGRGVATKLMRAVLEHPAVAGVRRVMLATSDAHELYRRLGFGAVRSPERWMAIEVAPEDAYGEAGSVQ